MSLLLVTPSSLTSVVLTAVVIPVMPPMYDGYTMQDVAAREDFQDNVNYTGTAGEIISVDETFLGTPTDETTVLRTGDTAGLSYLITDDKGNTATFVADPVTVQARVPAPPVNLRATGGDGIVDLVWEPPLSDNGAPVIGYALDRNEAGQGWQLLLANYPDLTYRDATVVNDTPYQYRARAINSVGESPNSTVATVTPAPSVAPTLEEFVLLPQNQTTGDLPIELKGLSKDSNVFWALPARTSRGLQTPPPSRRVL